MKGKNHFKIEIEFELESFKDQKDEMRRYQRSLEDITQVIFKGKINNLQSQLKEAKPVKKPSYCEFG